jgi:nucleoside-diphosphate-sugar epimerase
VSKARDLLGFEAKVDLEEGIRLSAEAWRERMAQEGSGSLVASAAR